MRLSKYIFLVLILIASLAFARGDYYKGAGSISCTEVYTPSLTADNALSIGKLATRDFNGMIYIPTANRCLCQVDVYVYEVAGTLSSSHDYYMRVFTIDGANNVDTIVGTSVKINGDSISGSAWLSASAGHVVFSPCLDLTSGEDYGLTFFVDTDGDQSDDPEADGTNYWRWGYDDERALDAISGGRAMWTWDAAIPYALEGSDAEDDMLVKIFSE